MKYIIVDAATRVILTYVEDTRLSTSLKSSLFDVDIITLYSHYDFYKNITDKNIEDNCLCISKQGIALKLDTEVPEYIKIKKLLALKKRKIVKILFFVTEKSLSTCNFFFNPSMTYLINDMLESKNEKLLDEYLSGRGLTKEEALKELKIKSDSFNHTLIKLQSTIDYFMEMIILENDISKLDIIENKIVSRMAIV
jgi:hypothetical protein